MLDRFFFPLVKDEGALLDPVIITLVLQVLKNCNSSEEALKVYQNYVSSRENQANIQHAVVMLDVLRHAGAHLHHCQQGLAVYHELLTDPLKFPGAATDIILANSMLRLLSSARAVTLRANPSLFTAASKILDALTNVTTTGALPFSGVYTKAIVIAGKSGDIAAAEAIYLSMLSRGIDKSDRSVYAVMTAAYFAKDYSRAFTLFEETLQVTSSEFPSVHTFARFLDVCRKMGNIAHGVKRLEEWEAAGGVPNWSILRSLLNLVDSTSKVESRRERSRISGISANNNKVGDSATSNSISNSNNDSAKLEKEHGGDGINSSKLVSESPSLLSSHSHAEALMAARRRAYAKTASQIVSSCFNKRSADAATEWVPRDLLDRLASTLTMQGHLDDLLRNCPPQYTDKIPGDDKSKEGIRFWSALIRSLSESGSWRDLLSLLERLRAYEGITLLSANLGAEALFGCCAALTQSGHKGRAASVFGIYSPAIIRQFSKRRVIAKPSILEVPSLRSLSSRSHTGSSSLPMGAASVLNQLSENGEVFSRAVVNGAFRCCSDHQELIACLQVLLGAAYVELRAPQYEQLALTLTRVQTPPAVIDAVFALLRAIGTFPEENVFLLQARLLSEATFGSKQEAASVWGKKILELLNANNFATAIIVDEENEGEEEDFNENTASASSISFRRDELMLALLAGGETEAAKSMVRLLSSKERQRARMSVIRLREDLHLQSTGEGGDETSTTATIKKAGHFILVALKNEKERDH